MTAKEKAAKLIEKFGKENAVLVVDELTERDKQWIEKLTHDCPDMWQESDFEKSKLMFDEVLKEIKLLTV
jgi:hypothetical protein